MEMCCGYRKEVISTALCFEEHGPFNMALKIDKVTLPPVGPEEVLIEVRATSINPHDWQITEGLLKDKLMINKPYIIGRDFSGIVKKSGSKVDNFGRGDRVFGYQPAKYNGAFSQFIVVNQRYIAKLDENLAFDEAAAIPYCGLLAYHVLRDIFDIKYNQKVWITNGSGGIGVWAVQIAKEMGAIVIATTSTENKGWIRKLGADEVVDYKLTKPEKYPKGIDYVFDTRGGIKETGYMQCMKAGGKIVSVVEDVDPAMASMFNVTGQYYEMNADASKLTEIVKMIHATKIKVQISKKFKLMEAMKGLESSRMGHVDGKIVVTIDEKDFDKTMALKEKFFVLESEKNKKAKHTAEGEATTRGEPTAKGDEPVSTTIPQTA
jgi:alcohol dehydrogenase